MHPGVKQGCSNTPHKVYAIRVAATHPKLSRAIRVAATHPSNIHNGMRVAATHPSNEQCSEGGSDTPCTVTDEATSGAHPHPGVNKLRWGGGPTRPATRR